MAHCIQSDDSIMTARTPAWHKIGVTLPNLATADEALKAASLEWTVEKWPAGIQNPDNPDEFIASDEKYFTVRADNKKLLGVVGESYTVLQNVDAFRMLDSITQDPNGPKYVSAGSLHGNRVVFAQCEFPEMLRFGKDDWGKHKLLLVHAHDGSKAIVIKPIVTRVVCQNTLTQGLSERSAAFMTRHTPGVMNKIEEVQDFFGILREETDLLMQAVKHMQSFAPSPKEVDAVLKQLIKPLDNPRLKPKDDSKYAEEVRGKIVHLFHDGEANKMAGDTATGWAFVNAITEYFEHDRPYRGDDADDNRVYSNWFGDAARMRNKAYDLVGKLR